MKTKINLGLILLLLAISLSCMRQDKSLPVEIYEAESVMWEYPDSALSLLSAMPQPIVYDKEAFATWGLLLVQARDKVYGKHLPDSLNLPSSDELVQNAMDYFEKVGDLKRMAQAYYYKGQLLEDQKKLTEAIPFYLKSKDVMTKLDEPLFTYLICQALGSLYRYQDLYKESLEQLKEASHYALLSGYGKRISSAYSELGRTFAECERLDSALYYFSKSLENAEAIEDLRLQVRAMGELGVVYRELGQYDEALRCIRKEISVYESNSLSGYLPQSYYSLANIWRKLGELDSATIYLKKALMTDNLYTIKSVYSTLYEISKEQGFRKEAIAYNDQYLIYADSLQKINHARELAEIQAKYDHEKLLNIANSLQIEKSRIVKIGLLLLVCLLTIIVFYQYNLLKKKKIIASIKEKIQEYEMEICENEKLIEINKNRIYLMNSEQMNVDEIRDKNKKLVEQNKQILLQIEDTKQLISSWSVKLDDQIPYFNKLKRLRSKPCYLKDADWDLIKNWVDLQYNHFTIRLEKDFPEFTMLDMRYCWLIKIGFTTSQIATCMAVSSASATKQKQRIKQRIKMNGLVSEKKEFSLDQYLREY